MASIPLLAGGIWAAPLNGGWLCIEIALLCVVLAAFGRQRSKLVAEFRISTVETDDDPVARTFIPSRPEVYYSSLAGHFVGIILCVSFLMAIPLSEALDASSSRYGGIFGYLAIPFLMGIVLIRLSSRFIVNRGTKLGVGLSTEGIHFGSWWGETRVRWTHIAYVEVVRVETRQSDRFRDKKPIEVCGIDVILNDRGLAHLRGNIPDSPVRYWKPVVKGLCKINAVNLDAHPSLVAHLLKFYRDHPELRDELGNERSVERIRTGDFLT